MDTLNGMFKEAWERPLFNINKTRNQYWTGYNPDFVGVVHPLTFERLQKAVANLKEPKMGGMDTDRCVEETPLQREVNHRKHLVRDLRESISRKKEKLGIALALLNAVRKLKGAK